MPPTRDHWFWNSGAEQLRQSGASYATYCEQSALPMYDEPHRSQIIRDLPRTRADHPQFKVLQSPGQHGVAKIVVANPKTSLIPPLERVLMAVVAKYPEGYCQGMNYVAAILLLHLDEEKAFWTMCAIKDLLYRNYWDYTLSGSQMEGQVTDGHWD
jgi:hypothetical protein